MAGVNKAILLGRLGKDPEMRYTPSGVAVCNFTLATSEKRKDKNGQFLESTEWHRITAFNKQAEVCGEHLKKGQEVYIEGKIQTREWEDRDGKKRYTTEILMSNFSFVGNKNDGPRLNPQPQPSSANLGYDVGYAESGDVPF